MPKTLYDKLINAHTILKKNNNILLYIDKHLIHEVTSPQAFESLSINNRNIWRTKSNLAVPDHNVPTKDRDFNNIEKIAKLQIETLSQNCKKFNINEINFHDKRQGIVHIIGPEQGATLPGMTIVCGDSHTSTHGALGALAFGIGTSEVEHVLATNCLWQQKSKNMQININGQLNTNVSAKDIALFIISKIGTAGGNGYAIEFCGDTIYNLSIEERMTLCNMAIEMGAKAGIIAVDDKTIQYIANKPMAPKAGKLKNAIKYWQTLHSDTSATFDKIINFKAKEIKLQVSWGTSPEMTIAIDEKIPDPALINNIDKKNHIINALKYIKLISGTKITDIEIDKVFIGSCTNARITDLRIAANVLNNNKIAKNIKLAIVVPGSGLVKQQAENEGLDKIFIKAGFEWRSAGCSMCLAMNDDKLQTGERCASTSNRNFEGRQGYDSYTHLVSPYTAAKSAICGHFCG